MKCIDTNVLIWAIHGFRDGETDDEDVVRTRHWIDGLVAKAKADRSHAAPLGVPAPALAEYLAGVPENRQGEATQAIAEAFHIIPFDAPAAGWFGRTWAAASATLSSATLRKNKMDITIVACAKASSAEALVAHDFHHLRFFASLIGVPVEDVPPRPLMLPGMDGGSTPAEQ